MLKKIALVLLFILSANVLPVSADVDYDYQEYKTLIGKQGKGDSGADIKKPFIGITSHHLPTAAPLIDDFFRRLKKTRPQIKTFVIIGPDHFEKCRNKSVLTGETLNTSFGKITINKKLASELVKSGVREEKSCFNGEHAIGVEANYIKKFFPQAQAVPILLSFSAKSRNFNEISKVLIRNRNDIFILQSTDFAHYVDADQASSIDAMSRKMILDLKGDSFSLKQIDSPASIKLVLGLVKSLRLKPKIIGHKNSFYFDGNFANTTSYFSVFF